MCPCDLSQHFVCGYHAKEIRDLLALMGPLEERELGLTEGEYDMLRALRGQLQWHNTLAVEIVAHQTKTREWEEANS